MPPDIPPDIPPDMFMPPALMPPDDADIDDEDDLEE